MPLDLTPADKIKKRKAEVVFLLNLWFFILFIKGF